MPAAPEKIDSRVQTGDERGVDGGGKEVFSHRRLQLLGAKPTDPARVSKAPTELCPFAILFTLPKPPTDEMFAIPYI